MSAVTLILGVFLACIKPCQGKAGCEIEISNCLLESGRVREAIERLKPLAKKHPAYARLLARAYLADNNPAWALRTLKAAAARDETDCESRSWLAWVYVTEGFLDLAIKELDRPGCPVAAVDRTRWLLLRTYIARMEADPVRTVGSPAQANDLDVMYPEDQELLSILRSRADPGWIVTRHMAHVPGRHVMRSVSRRWSLRLERR